MTPLRCLGPQATNQRVALLDFTPTNYSPTPILSSPFSFPSSKLFFFFQFKIGTNFNLSPSPNPSPQEITALSASSLIAISVSDWTRLYPTNYFLLTKHLPHVTNKNITRLLSSISYDSLLTTTTSSSSSTSSNSTVDTDFSFHLSFVAKTAYCGKSAHQGLTSRQH